MNKGRLTMGRDFPKDPQWISNGGETRTSQPRDAWKSREKQEINASPGQTSPSGEAALTGQHPLRLAGPWGRFP
jgi:hypothetical protein